jgi:hypothetical protein
MTAVTGRRSTILIGCLIACAAQLGCSEPAFRLDPGTLDSIGNGKADDPAGFSLRQLGPLPLTAPPQRLSLERQIPVWRVVSHGGTAIEVELHAARGQAVLLVKRLAGDGDNGTKGSTLVTQATGRPARLELKLTDPGVYAIYAAHTRSEMDPELDPTQELELEARCTSGCYRNAISASYFLTLLRDSGQLDAALKILAKQLDVGVADVKLRQQLAGALGQLAKAQTFDGVDRLLTVPLKKVHLLRPALGQLSSGSTPAQPGKIDGDLGLLLGPCNAEARSEPGPLHQALPLVTYGHFPDRALTRCQVTHSVRLAQILTALAANNGSTVRYHGRTARSPRELITMLINTGHEVALINERTYANFLALSLDGREVIWPVWIDTGLKLADSSSLSIPTGHSHHAWHVSGPEVQARVAFYLGIDGVGFWPLTQSRPGWTGQRTEHRASTSTGQAPIVLEALELAATYQQRLRLEHQTYAPKMPASGYGYLGVCNDSTAVIEYGAFRTITTYPLARAADLKSKPALGDGLDAILTLLPADTGTAVPRSDAVSRVLAMTPHTLDAPELWDETLRAQLKAIAAE